MKRSSPCTEWVLPYRGVMVVGLREAVKQKLKQSVLWEQMGTWKHACVIGTDGRH